ncbi:MAG: SAM-dependent methyltransferase [Coleofasciculus sp. C1-SOL-03]|uniref:SAM-dependent methyltransferase n=1 Tax=Coleofasciculus sp. C1-SOL-03 TaxID=3069522 RepID=UPI0032F49328
MAFKLETVIPWGRSLDEYVRMFDLQPDELKFTLLDCAGGPASFNAEMTRQGYTVISCDPIYQFPAKEIKRRIQEVYPTVIDGVTANRDNYVWQTIESPEALGQIRLSAMEQFVDDLSMGIEQGRYINAALPILPFTMNQFNLAVCSHFLFSYSDLLSLEFHLNSIRELCRVADQVRIFPLVDISGEISPHLSPVIREFNNQGYNLEIKQVAYEFQKGGNQMLQVTENVETCHGASEC